jgi:hypothetical protein
MKLLLRVLKWILATIAVLAVIGGVAFHALMHTMRRPFRPVEMQVSRAPRGPARQPLRSQPRNNAV